MTTPTAGETSPLRRLLERRTPLVLARCGMILMVLYFLRVVGAIEVGDLVLLGLLLGAAFSLLALPAGLASTETRHWALLVVDGVLLIFGGYQANLPVFWLAWFLLVGVALVLARSLGQLVLVGVSAAALGTLVASAGPTALTTQPAWLGGLWVAALAVSLALYLGILGLPLGSRHLQEELLAHRNACRGRALADIRRLTAARSSADLTARLLSAVAAIDPHLRVEIWSVKGDRASPTHVPDPDERRERSVDSLPGLGQCLSAGQAVAGPRRDVGGRKGPGAAELPSVWERWVPLRVEEQGRGGAALRVERDASAPDPAELEHLEEVAAVAAACLEILTARERADEDERLTQSALQDTTTNLQQTGRALTALTRISQATDTGQALERVGTTLGAVVGFPTTHLFLTNAERTQVIDRVSPTTEPTRIPVEGSLLGRALTRDSILFRSLGSNDSGATAMNLDERTFLSTRDCEGVLLLPLAPLPGQPPFGVLMLGSPDRTEVRPEQLDLLGRVKDTVGRVIWLLLAREAGERDAAGRAAIQSWTAELGATRRPGDIPPLLGDWAHQHLEGSEVELLLYAPDSRAFLSTAAASAPLSADSGLGAEIFRLGRTLDGGGRPPSADPGRPVPGPLLCPVRRGESWLGLLRFDNPDGALPAHWVPLAEQAAACLALALPEPAASRPVPRAGPTVRDEGGPDPAPAARAEGSTIAPPDNRASRWAGSPAALPEEGPDPPSADSDPPDPPTTPVIESFPEHLEPNRLLSLVLGPEGRPGPHVVPALRTLIDRLLGGGLPIPDLTDLLHDMLNLIDAPSQRFDLRSGLKPFIEACCAEYELEEERQSHLHLALRVYDIGKLALPADILLAPHRLEGPDLEAVRRHVSLGVQEILQPHRVFQPLLLPIRFHHEHWDGSGYPWQLSGEEIPIESRLLGLLDAFRAMSLDRPYRRRLTPAQILQQLTDGGGSRFDPGLTRRLLRRIRTPKSPP